jgi:hypothetical protein
MKVTGPSGVGSAQGPRPARAGGGEGFRIFTPQQVAGPGQASSVSAAQGVMGVEALLALQDVGNPTERKRRAVGRAGRILDVLDHIKVAMLDGDLSGADLDRLRRAVRENAPVRTTRSWKRCSRRSSSAPRSRSPSWSSQTVRLNRERLAQVIETVVRFAISRARVSVSLGGSRCP